MGSKAPLEGARSDDDDHDLLTYGEAGARLAEEVRRLEGAAAAAEGDGDEVRALLHRAEQLRAAVARNGRRAADDSGAKGFLTYRPPSGS